MISSSELQRVSLSATKIIASEGVVQLEPFDDEVADDVEVQNEDSYAEENNINSVPKKSDLEIISEEATKPLSVVIDNELNHQKTTENLTNGIDNSPTAQGNETINSSVGDITVDSVRDHLNSTITTLHSTTTEEIVGMY